MTHGRFRTPQKHPKCSSSCDILSQTNFLKYHDQGSSPENVIELTPSKLQCASKLEGAPERKKHERKGSSFGGSLSRYMPHVKKLTTPHPPQIPSPSSDFEHESEHKSEYDPHVENLKMTSEPKKSRSNFQKATMEEDKFDMDSLQPTTSKDASLQADLNPTHDNQPPVRDSCATSPWRISCDSFPASSTMPSTSLPAGRLVMNDSSLQSTHNKSLTIPEILIPQNQTPTHLVAPVPQMNIGTLCIILESSDPHSEEPSFPLTTFQNRFPAKKKAKRERGYL
jgi:hypothetical protein